MHSAREPKTLQPEPEGEHRRLHLSGVDTPIVTRVTRQSERGMTVEQALPFLQLRTSVWGEAQKPSHIESVSIVVYDGIPRLVLDLAFDDEDELSAQPAAPERKSHPGVLRPRTHRDETVPFERESVQLAAAAASATAQPKAARREESIVFSTALADAEKPIPAVVADLALSSMERQLLQPRDWVFQVRYAWQRSKPWLLRAKRASVRTAKLLAQRGLPVIARAWPALQQRKRRAMTHLQLAWRQASAPRPPRS